MQDAAAAAQEATTKLQAVLQEKEEVEGELVALRQQLEAQPNTNAQHAGLYERLLVGVPGVWEVCWGGVSCGVLADGVDG